MDTSRRVLRSMKRYLSRASLNGDDENVTEQQNNDVEMANNAPQSDHEIDAEQLPELLEPETKTKSNYKKSKN